MTTILQRGSVAREIEFEARGINADGDACDVHFYDTADEAKAVAVSLLGDDDDRGGKIVAWMVERHTSYHPAHLAPRGREPDEYERIAWGGSGLALAAGGWIEVEETAPSA
jgi:hypothetical protein